MLTRIVTAVIGAVAAFFIISVGGWLLTAVAFMISLMAWTEYAHMMKSAGKDVYSWPAVTVIVVVVAAAASHILPVFLAAVLFCFVFILGTALFIPQENVSFLFRTLAGAMYIGMGMGSFVLLREGEALLPYTELTMDTGLFLIWFALLGTWASDTFAFFVGKLCGRHLMASHISPHKTVEGLFGGIAGAICVCLAYSWYFHYSLLGGAMLGVLISLAAPLGDLFESFIKRTCGTKDSGHILPGHGGILDRFDSLLFVAPVMVAFLIAAEQL